VGGSGWVNTSGIAARRRAEGGGRYICIRMHVYMYVYLPFWARGECWRRTQDLLVCRRVYIPLYIQSFGHNLRFACCRVRC